MMVPLDKGYHIVRKIVVLEEYLTTQENAYIVS